MTNLGAGTRCVRFPRGLRRRKRQDCKDAVQSPPMRHFSVIARLAIALTLGEALTISQVKRRAPAPPKSL